MLNTTHRSDAYETDRPKYKSKSLPFMVYVTGLLGLLSLIFGSVTLIGGVFLSGTEPQQVPGLGFIPSPLAEKIAADAGDTITLCVMLIVGGLLLITSYFITKAVIQTRDMMQHIVDR